jgi:hypothetical protein
LTGIDSRISTTYNPAITFATISRLESYENLFYHLSLRFSYSNGILRTRAAHDDTSYSDECRGRTIGYTDLDAQSDGDGYARSADGDGYGNSHIDCHTNGYTHKDIDADPYAHSSCVLIDARHSAASNR